MLKKMLFTTLSLTVFAIPAISKASCINDCHDALEYAGKRLSHLVSHSSAGVYISKVDIVHVRNGQHVDPTGCVDVAKACKELCGAK